MGTKEDAEAEIQRRVQEKRGATIAASLIGPVVGVLTGSPQAAVDLFTAPSKALGNVRHEAEQDLVLEILADVADTLRAGQGRARAENLSWVSIAGTIEAEGVDVGAVTGVDVDAGSGPVTVEPQTRISAKGERAESVTGMSIKGNPRPGVTTDVRLGAADSVQKASARVETGVRCRYCGSQATLSSTVVVGDDEGPRLCSHCGRPLD